MSETNKCTLVCGRASWSLCDNVNNKRMRQAHNLLVTSIGRCTHYARACAISTQRQHFIFNCVSLVTTFVVPSFRIDRSVVLSLSITPITEGNDVLKKHFCTIHEDPFAVLVQQIRKGIWYFGTTILTCRYISADVLPNGGNLTPHSFSIATVGC